MADAGRLGDNVGGQGFAWNQKLGKKVFTFGYPTGPHPDGNKPYTGDTMKWCYGTTAAAPAVPKYKVRGARRHQVRLHPRRRAAAPSCCSTRAAKRTGYLNGVVSLTLDTDGNKRYDRVSSPYFNGETYGIYKYAANLWTGKLPRLRTDREREGARCPTGPLRSLCQRISRRAPTTETPLMQSLYQRRHA